ncbi:MAG: hemerythrin domain-containing protein [Alphaproteobacteria bacterium]|nr:hemerythrin domain-containing protein [Alphaproteobacteria bacterium]
MIADDLPRADSIKCATTADSLQSAISATQLLEEEILFPLLVAQEREELEQTILRLKSEHLTDKFNAEEVGYVLRGLAVYQSDLSADAVGYLLRAFFEGVRRHIRSEQELIRLFSKVSSQSAIVTVG